MSAEPVSGLGPAALVLRLLRPAGHRLHQVDPVEVLLVGLHPLPAQLRHLHGHTGVLAGHGGQLVVPQCLVDITGFSEVKVKSDWRTDCRFRSLLPSLMP